MKKVLKSVGKLFGWLIEHYYAILTLVVLAKGILDHSSDLIIIGAVMCVIVGHDTHYRKTREQLDRIEQKLITIDRNMG